MIYFVRRPSDGFIKIGFSDNMHVRMVDFRVKLGKGATLLGMVEGGLSTEREIHARFNDHRIDPVAEWFYPADEIVDFIHRHTHLEMPKDKSSKVVVTLPDDLYQLLADESEAEDKPIAAIVRSILSEHYQIKVRSNWGGYRRGDKKDRN
jgi:hypothetical protein